MTTDPTTDPTWLIRGARPLGGPPADLLLAGGVIEQAGPGLSAPAGAQVLDAGGLIALPGLVDLHT
ncbi:MAG TPA: dihydroorotase, partial [Streptosporangiaceae bacterium]|nr:dihydroorotase [Streptosporangiaceae bacterium]